MIEGLHSINDSSDKVKWSDTIIHKKENLQMLYIHIIKQNPTNISQATIKFSP